MSSYKEWRKSLNEENAQQKLNSSIKIYEYVPKLKGWFGELDLMGHEVPVVIHEIFPNHRLRKRHNLTLTFKTVAQAKLHAGFWWEIWVPVLEVK